MSKKPDDDIEFAYPESDDAIRDIINFRASSMTIAVILFGPIHESTLREPEKAYRIFQERFLQLEAFSDMVGVYLLAGLSDLQKARLVPKSKNDSGDQCPK
jgi:hypothetical protein